MTPIIHQVHYDARLKMDLIHPSIGGERIELVVQYKDGYGNWFDTSQHIPIGVDFSLSDLISFLQRAEKLMVLQ